ncbi:MAG: hypothetical protein Q8L90_04995 [Bacteroidota bacterium]|nr:hypothetical protein [Bacteroidota bacterium]
MKKKRNEELDSPKQISKPNRIKQGVKKQSPIKKVKPATLVEEMDNELIDDDELELYEDNEDFM